MKYLLPTTLLFLVACVGGNEFDAEMRFVEDCVADTGQSEARCKCWMNAIIDGIGAEQFQALERQSISGDQAGADQWFAEYLDNNPSAKIQIGMAVSVCVN